MNKKFEKQRRFDPIVDHLLSAANLLWNEGEMETYGCVNDLMNAVLTIQEHYWQEYLTEYKQQIKGDLR